MAAHWGSHIIPTKGMALEEIGISSLRWNSLTLHRCDTVTHTISDMSLPAWYILRLFSTSHVSSHNIVYQCDIELAYIGNDHFFVHLIWYLRHNRVIPWRWRHDPDLRWPFRSPIKTSWTKIWCCSHGVPTWVYTLFCSFEPCQTLLGLVYIWNFKKGFVQKQYWGRESCKLETFSSITFLFWYQWDIILLSLTQLEPWSTY